MPFEAGKSGNPTGRKKGAKNKVNSELRERISDFLETNFDKIEKDFKKLSPAAKLKFYTELLPYVVPKLQNTSMDISFEDMTESQLDSIIEKIVNKNQNGS